MFIDIHCHAYRIPPPIYSMSTPDQVVEVFDRLGIEKGALLPIVSPEVYLPQANEDILEMCAQYPDRFFPFCNVDPRAICNSSHAPLGDVLRAYKDKGCKGVGEIMPNLPIMDDMVQNLFKCAEEVGLPVTTDGSPVPTCNFGLYDEPGLPGLEFTLRRYPNLIYLGHGPCFWTEIAQLETPGERGYLFRMTGGQCGRQPTHPIKEEGVLPKLMRLYPNLYGDLSDDSPRNALARDPEYGPKFLTEFQDRLLFGTDLCFPTMPVKIVDLLIEWRDSGKITEAVFQKVARENAIKLFGLE
ncbi:amidohydrolase family protein [bacterium]|nr:amidohydrolase family protein [bacterium]